MTDEQVGSLAHELQLLAAAISAQDSDSPDSVVGMIRGLLAEHADTKTEPPQVQRIDLT